MTKPPALQVLPLDLSVVRLPPDSAVPGWAMGGGFYSVTGTGDELSLVCESARVPGDVVCEPGWRAIVVDGPLDFAEIGVLAGLTRTLARSGISVFVISTYDTDYVLMKKPVQDQALKALTQAGYEVRS